MNFFDRQILGAVAEPIRKEFGLSDASLGALSTAFTLIYALVGVPLGRLADRSSRKTIISAGVFVWSLMTAASGLATNFWQIFVLRLGVGVGEASCAPAATSLIGDLFPPDKRARALSIFMLGLPVGLALSFAVSGIVVRQYGWRAAFVVAGIPGVLFAIGALFIREPERGGSEAYNVGTQKRPGSPYRLVLSSPTILWLIASGALAQFQYVRHRRISHAVPDALSRCRHPNGEYRFDDRLRSARRTRTSAGRLHWRCSNEATLKWPHARRSDRDRDLDSIHHPGPGSSGRRSRGFYDPDGARLRADVLLLFDGLLDYSGCNRTRSAGTAMALYFMAMYLLGASFGPYIIGLVSDHFTQQAALGAGVTIVTQQSLEPFRADGLHSAMYIIPVLSALLAVVMFAASRTVAKEIAALKTWMQDSFSKE